MDFKGDRHGRYGRPRNPNDAILSAQDTDQHSSARIEYGYGSSSVKPFRILERPKMKPLQASLTCCQRLIPGLGLRMGMERSGSTPPPAKPQLQLILMTGQSLNVGANGTPPVSTTQPGNNKMFVGGVRAVSGQLASLVPLVATVDADPAGGFDGETIANSMADLLSLATPTNSFIVACHGQSGFRYVELKKGTAPYALGMEQAQGATDLGGGTYAGVLAVATCHGEQDQAFNTTDYAGDLAEWQFDYNGDLKAITGQTADVPLLVYQQCSSPPSGADSAATSTALESLKAYEADPTKIVLVGPNYPWVRKDGIHLTAHGYRSMGVLYAEVLRVIQAGGTWSPLRPISIQRTGAIIDITYHVPVPPISFDLARVFNPGNFGFSYTDDSASASVQGVAITGATTVRVTLDGTPTGSNKLIRYGWTGTNWPGGSGPAGPLGSARGCLRDAGYSANIYGYDAFNWGVLFSKPVT
jgi:hypothetical protein